MNTIDVTMVRLYLHEGAGQLETLLAYLHDESKVKGVTVFRGISGFGKSGTVHSSRLIDMSLDLPVVIEFFEEPEKAKTLIEYLNTQLNPGHIVYWPSKLSA